MVGRCAKNFGFIINLGLLRVQHVPSIVRSVLCTYSKRYWLLLGRVLTASQPSHNRPGPPVVVKSCPSHLIHHYPNANEPLRMIKHPLIAEWTSSYDKAPRYSGRDTPYRGLRIRGGGCITFRRGLTWSTSLHLETSGLGNCVLACFRPLSSPGGRCDTA